MTRRRHGTYYLYSGFPGHALSPGPVKPAPLDVSPLLTAPDGLTLTDRIRTYHTIPYRLCTEQAALGAAACVECRPWRDTHTHTERELFSRALFDVCLFIDRLVPPQSDLRRLRSQAGGKPNAGSAKAEIAPYTATLPDKTSSESNCRFESAQVGII
ncbi:hypothetical protein VTN02DRAFT_416 [Thermoascus thermophilus]